jgi:hypothetical protein
MIQQWWPDLREYYQVGAISMCFLPLFKPDFTPPKGNASGTEHSAFTVMELILDPLQHHSGCHHLRHLVGLFVRKPLDSYFESAGATAIQHKVDIETHAETE